MAWGAVWRDILRDYDPRRPKGRGRAIMALGAFLAGILFAAAAFSSSPAAGDPAVPPQDARASAGEGRSGADGSRPGGTASTDSTPMARGGSGGGHVADDDAGNASDPGAVQYDQGGDDAPTNATADPGTEESGWLPEHIGSTDSVDGLPPTPLDDGTDVDPDGVPIP